MRTNQLETSSNAHKKIAVWWSVSCQHHSHTHMRAAFVSEHHRLPLLEAPLASCAVRSHNSDPTSSGQTVATVNQSCVGPGTACPCQLWYLRCRDLRSANSLLPLCHLVPRAVCLLVRSWSGHSAPPPTDGYNWFCCVCVETSLLPQVTACL